MSKKSTMFGPDHLELTFLKITGKISLVMYSLLFQNIVDFWFIKFFLSWFLEALKSQFKTKICIVVEDDVEILVSHFFRILCKHFPQSLETESKLCPVAQC